MLEDEPVGFPVLHVIANDEDSHLNGEVVYSIASGNVGQHFAIDSETGLITLSKVWTRVVLVSVNLYFVTGAGFRRYVLMR